MTALPFFFFFLNKGSDLTVSGIGFAFFFFGGGVVEGGWWWEWMWEVWNGGAK